MDGDTIENPKLHVQISSICQSTMSVALFQFRVVNCFFFQHHCTPNTTSRVVFWITFLVSASSSSFSHSGSTDGVDGARSSSSDGRINSLLRCTPGETHGAEEGTDGREVTHLGGHHAGRSQSLNQARAQVTKCPQVLQSKLLKEYGSIYKLYNVTT